MDRHRKGFVTFDIFEQIISDWGFVTKQSDVKKLFDWLDFDRDQKLSFVDFKNTIGFEILPQESFFFRQDVKPSKEVICKYKDCWENITYNTKSPYCPLHVQVLKNNVADLFERVSTEI